MEEAERAHRAALVATKAASDRSDALRSSWYAAERQLKQVQDQIKGIREAGRSKAAQFGGKPMQALVTAVQRAKADFKRPPIGPVGQYLTLQDGRSANETGRGWAQPEDAVLGGALFCCARMCCCWALHAAAAVYAVP